MKITVGLVDDHQLFLKSLSVLIDTFTNCKVIVEATRGKDLLQKLEKKDLQPDILLIDVSMPEMDGIEVTEAVTQKYPIIKTVALSSKDDDTTIINMIKAGCCAYLLKEIHPDELEKALSEVYNKGYYNADAFNIRYRRFLRNQEAEIKFSEKEKRFLQLACSDRTYKQIAAEMHLSERTIDGYREALFEKLKVQSRVGMVLEAIRRGIVSIDEC